jgi:O-acetyl-ADP-ribose deacetylase (regulator of RNase III)
VIRVTLEPLQDLAVSAVLRPIRSDLAPVSAASRDVGERTGERPTAMLERLGSLPVGSAVLTPAGDLAADYLIHVVVMSEDEHQTAATVDKALRNGLARANDLGLNAIALPPLGIGAGLMEPEEAATALLEILGEHLETGDLPQDIVLAVPSAYEADLFTNLIEGSERRKQD